MAIWGQTPDVHSAIVTILKSSDKKPGWPKCFQLVLKKNNILRFRGSLCSLELYKWYCSWAQAFAGRALPFRGWVRVWRPAHAPATHHQLPTAHQLQLGYQVNKVLVEQTMHKDEQMLVLTHDVEKVVVEGNCRQLVKAAVEVLKSEEEGALLGPRSPGRAAQLCAGWRPGIIHQVSWRTDLPFIIIQSVWLAWG